MLSDLAYRFRALFHRKELDAELDEELRDHFEREAEKYIRSGAQPQEAKRRARLALGGPEQIRQQCREARGIRFVENSLQDMRYSARTLARNPGFTMVITLTLALGIGACTAIFSLLNAVLLPPLPYGDISQLVYLYTPNRHLTDVPFDAFPPANADFSDLKRQSHSYSNMTQFQQGEFKLIFQRAETSIGGAKVDADFFPTLESHPEVGRTIDAEDNQPGQDGVALISHSLWQQMFAGSRDVLGQSLQLDDRTYRIVGVMPPGFHYPHKTDLDYGDGHIDATNVWIPLALSPKQRADRGISSNGYALARMKPGVSVKQAQAEMGTIMKRLDLLHATPFLQGWGAHVKPFRQTLDGSARPLMWLLMGAVCFVLLIACGNAANLLLARNASRTHELGVRVTLGAGRSRLIHQMLTESLMLGASGGLVGTGLAWLFLHLFLHLDPGNIPRLKEASLNVRVLFFTVAITLLTGVFTGVLPALSSSRINLVEFLKSGGNRGAIGNHNRLRSGLIVGEVAMVFILLAGASLLLRSYINIESTPTGFSSATLSMKIDLPVRYRQTVQRRAFYRSLIERIRTIPGVQAAGAVDNLPLSHRESVGTFWVEGYANRKGQTVEGFSATPGYFSAMNTPLLEGRPFTDDDDSGRPEVAIINEAFAKKYFAGRDPIGRWVRTDQPNNPAQQYTSGKTIVGVIADVRVSSLEQPVQPQLFLPFWQGNPNQAYVAVRSILPPSEVAATARSILRRLDPGLSFADMHTMGDRVSEATARRRFQTVLFVLFSTMAMLLALVGLYGLLAYTVRQRTAELGVRIALGASRRRVMQLILRQGLRLVAAGLVLGLVGAIALTRVLASFLYGVRATDPLTFFLVPLLLLMTAFAACFIPGWKAANIDPVHALRSE